MKALIKFALAAVMLITTLTAQAGWVSGHYRSNGTYVALYYRSDYGSVGRSYGSSSGYVFRNPYAAYPRLTCPDTTAAAAPTWRLTSALLPTGP